MKKLILMTTIFLASSLAVAGPIKAGIENDIDPLGPHHPLFIITKYPTNPQNQLVIYTSLNSACDIKNDGFSKVEKPIFGFYWLMNGTTYKPLNWFFVKAFEFNKFNLRRDPQDFKKFILDLPYMTNFRHDLPVAQMQIVGEKVRDGCVVKSFLKLGPSGGNQWMIVDAITTVSGGFWKALKLNEITFQGTLPGGKRHSVTFKR